MANEGNAPRGWLARLFGASQDDKSEEKSSETVAEFAATSSASETLPTAAPVATAPEIVPTAMPATALPDAPLAIAVAAPSETAPHATPAEAPVAGVDVEEPPLDLGLPPVAAEPELCPSCRSARQDANQYCGDCGWMFAAPGKGTARSTTQKVTMAKPAVPAKIKDRYEVGALINERGGISRCKGIDHGAGGIPVTIVWGPLADAPEAVLPLDDLPLAEVEEITPGFDDVPVAKVGPAGVPWPSVAWERDILTKAQHASLPKILDSFVENSNDYLILESPDGRILWDAWDDPDANSSIRYGWLKQVAEGLHALHQAGAVLEGVRPDLVTVTNAGQAMLSDLSDLLPLPLPLNAPIRASLYTAPEMILNPDQVDARATLYSFGAMIYSLEYLHHGLEERDFEKPYTPRQVTDRFPDVHPLFHRLINKTFTRDLSYRFPTDEVYKTDPSGCTELIRTLEVCQRTFDQVRLDIAAWTTIGMIRTGNEDALTFMHGVDTRQDDVREYAMVLLADGMGGYDAGEVAAAMCMDILRQYLLKQPMFAALTGGTPPPGPVNVDGYKTALREALRHANKEIHTFGRTPGKGKRGMGCTAEAVYIDSENVICGHVGDSRVYHLHQGKLIQLTRDQTLVNRLVELGQLTEEEAEDHPRKNELQQAIGGQPDVNPGVYSGKLKRGDWVLVCSDGLTNHIPSADLEKMLTREAAYSAEEAARRLLNLVNLRGATDNATIVVVRAT